MIKALVDYKELIWNPSMEWLKRHWKGYLLFVALLYGVPMTLYYREEIMDKIKSMFRKDKEDKGA